MSEKKYNAPAAAKTLMILEYMAQQSRSIGVSDLADALNITVNSTYRILHEMEHMGYVYKTDAQKYGLTPRLYYMGRLAQPVDDINHYTRSTLHELAEISGETALLCTLTDDYKVFVSEMIESPLPLKFVSRVGYDYPAHVSALGKVLLSKLSKTRLYEFYKHNQLYSITQNSITQKEYFEKQLKKIEKQGYAFDDEESLDGVFCIGAPIFNDKGQIAMSIGISGPKARVTSNLEENIRTVTETAKKISIMFGSKL